MTTQSAATIAEIRSAPPPSLGAVLLVATNTVMHSVSCSRQARLYFMADNYSSSTESSVMKALNYLKSLGAVTGAYWRNFGARRPSLLSAAS